MIDSVIGAELRKRMNTAEQTAGGVNICKVSFDPGFRGFEGHFEGNPIVPGVCLIELARLHAETILARALRTQKIILCRFRSPVLAGMTVECRTTVRQNAEPSVRIQSEIRTDGSIACQLRLDAEAL